MIEMSTGDLIALCIACMALGVNIYTMISMWFKRR